ncbi:hypothetical protein NSU24_24120, partial [Salmonella enterica]|nr:hypothetical protein [Salmonella enterica]
KGGERCGRFVHGLGGVQLAGPGLAGGGHDCGGEAAPCGLGRAANALAKALNQALTKLPGVRMDMRYFRHAGNLAWRGL